MRVTKPYRPTGPNRDRIDVRVRAGYDPMTAGSSMPSVYELEAATRSLFLELDGTGKCGTASYLDNLDAALRNRGRTIQGRAQVYRNAIRIAMGGCGATGYTPGTHEYESLRALYDGWVSAERVALSYGNRNDAASVHGLGEGFFADNKNAIAGVALLGLGLWALPMMHSSLRGADYTYF